jgi:hypothetical protein
MQAPGSQSWCWWNLFSVCWWPCVHTRRKANDAEQQQPVVWLCELDDGVAVWFGVVRVCVGVEGTVLCCVRVW